MLLRVSQNRISPTQSSPSSSFPDELKADLDRLTSDKHVMVFCGFSQRGYADIQGLESAVRQAIKQAASHYGTNKICVVAGATPEGIGVVYRIAKEIDTSILTLGIVSELARGGTLSEHCDVVKFVRDPDHTWQVKDDSGSSSMVYVATSSDTYRRSGEMLAFGGGKVTQSELHEARKEMVAVKEFSFNSAS